MDRASQQLFDSLIAKAPHELSASDIEFLKARQSYLTPDQQVLFFGAPNEKPAKAKKSEK